MVHVRVRSFDYFIVRIRVRGQKNSLSESVSASATDSYTSSCPNPCPYPPNSDWAKILAKTWMETFLDFVVSGELWNWIKTNWTSAPNMLSWIYAQIFLIKLHNRVVSRLIGFLFRFIFYHSFYLFYYFACCSWWTIFKLRDPFWKFSADCVFLKSLKFNVVEIILTDYKITVR